MSKFKSMPLKIWLFTLTAVLAIVSLSAGVIWAAITISGTFNNNSVPTATLSTQVWNASSGGTALTDLTTSTTASKTLYVSATNAGTAITVPCVMRARATTAASGVLTWNGGWTAQDNGWYYCNTIVGGSGNTGRIPMVAVSSAGFEGNIAIELMQFTSTDDAGFVKYWAPLGGRATSGNSDIISTTSTIDGLTFASTSTDSSGHFAAFNQKTSGRVQYAALASDSSVSVSNALIAPIPAGDYSNGSTANLTITSISGKNLVIYNNSVVPMVFTITYQAVAYATTNGTTYTKTDDVAFNLTSYNAGSGWTDLTSSVAGHYVYSAAVQPGEYINALDDAITITFTRDTAQEIAANTRGIRITATITAEDVDSMNAKVASADSKYADYDKYSGKVPASKYSAWLSALASTNTAFDIPSYTAIAS